MMSSDHEQRRERQIDEVEVLKAVYLDDFKDMRAGDAWKVYRPPEVCIHLVPLQSMHSNVEVYTHIDLIVKCPLKYPDEIPELRLENPKGLSNQHIASLKQALNELALTKRGEVMIYDLAQYVQNYLEPYNKAAPKSFYDEMMHNQRKQAQLVAIEQQRLEEKEIELIEVEIQKRQQEMRQDTRRRKEARMEKASPEPSTSPGNPFLKDIEMRARSASSPRSARRDSESNNPNNHNNHNNNAGGNGRDERTPRRLSSPVRRASDDAATLQPELLVTSSSRRPGSSSTRINFAERTILRGRFHGASSRGCDVYTGMDANTGELVTMTEWMLRWRQVSRPVTPNKDDEPDKEAQKYIKHLTNVAHELHSLIKLDHPNLVRYLAMTTLVEHGSITVYVLKEHVNGGSLEMHLRNHSVPLPYDLLRYYTSSVLAALGYLHDKAVTHKDIRESSVFLDDAGTVRLADYSLEKRLSGLYETLESSRPGVQFSGLESDRPHVLGRSAKKADVYQLGLLVLALAVGRPLTEAFPEIPSTLPADLHDFLQKCMMKDEKLRWSTTQLADHEFVRQPSRSEAGFFKRARPEPDPVVAKQLLNDEFGVWQYDVSAMATETSGQSRLTREFEVLEWLGKGGFGDVMKVRNKLDGRCYAIKRILLNPKSKHFNKKITREVKLLSRLNHENVVRYYYSWIETSVDAVGDDFNCSSSTATSTSATKPDDVKLNNSLDIKDNVEAVVPAIDDGSVEWSISEYVPRHGAPASSSASSDEGEEDDESVDNVGAVFDFPAMFDNEDSFGVVFEHSSLEKQESVKAVLTDELSGCEKQERKDRVSELEPPTRAQFLYIQMEFCEKSTLKHCIEAGLYQDQDRVWRLFREIVEGLDHIHEQGMIHRDLKPVNVFLDSNDHVKIGDFGLATTSIIARQQTLAETTGLLVPDVTYSQSRSAEGGDLTGKVGTSLYVSPEISSSATTRTNYTQKVDIYSLGIIFFEMCYHALPTGMERVKVLSNLRKEEVQIPDDFDVLEMPNQVTIVRWLLHHDPAKRPSSKELLVSDYLPPPLMEEAELTELLRSTISNPQSKAYKRMISAMFTQPVSAAADYTYDIDYFRGNYNAALGVQMNHVHHLLEQVFQRHGGVQLHAQLLMPKNTMYDQNDQYACFMDRSGGLVALPYDLRVPFARFVARNNVTAIKRYCIERVYREKKIYGIHPGQPTEAAFDIVTVTAGSLIADAELIRVVQEVIVEFPQLQAMNYFLRVNHWSLLKGILLYYGVAEELHTHVIQIINDNKATPHKDLDRYSRLAELHIADSSIVALNSLLSAEGPVELVEKKLIGIMKSKGLAGSLVKKGLHELKVVLANAEYMGCKFQAVLVLMLVPSVHLYCGVMFQVAGKIVRKNQKFVLDILAVGGRYDGLVAKFRRRTLHGTPQSAVGLSIAVDKIVAAVTEPSGEETAQISIPPVADVLICTVGHKVMIKEQLQLANQLWGAGIRAVINGDTALCLEDIQDHCLRHGIKNLAILKDQDAGSVKVQSVEKERILEKKMSTNEVVEYVQKRSAPNSKIETGDQVQMTTKSCVGVSDTQLQHSSSNQQSLYVTTFLFELGSKISSIQRKKYESQMYPKIMATVKMLSPRLRLEVLALDLAGQRDNLLKTIIGHLDIDGDEKAFEASISAVLERYPRYRRYLARVFDTVHELRYSSRENRCPPIMFYALKDDCYKLLLCCNS